MASTLRTYKREILFEKDKPNVMGSYMQPKYQIRHTIIYKVTPLLLLLFRLLSYILIKDRKCKVCYFFYDISSSYYFALWADAHAFVHLVGLESTIQIKCFNCIYLIIKYRSFIIQCTSCEPHFFTVPQFLGALASVHCKHVSASEKTLASIRF